MDFPFDIIWFALPVRIIPKRRALAPAQRPEQRPAALPYRQMALFFEKNA